MAWQEGVLENFGQKIVKKILQKIVILVYIYKKKK